MSINLEDALTLIYELKHQVDVESVELKNSAGRVVATDIVATNALPPCDNSAMDGYAIKLIDTSNIAVCHESLLAGDNRVLSLSDGETIKIMTGAKIPDGCEAVVPIEDVVLNGKMVTLPNKISKGQHIRKCGEDIAIGECVVKCGEKLHAHHIAILASQGVDLVNCYKRVRVAIVSSGDELVKHDKLLAGSHQLYDANTPMLLARLSELGCDVFNVDILKDDLDSFSRSIESLLDYDLIVTTGGASVGDSDITKDAFRLAGFKALFEGVDIRPGKPTTVGTVDKTVVLNLPGNPLAAAVNFEIFGSALVSKLSGTNKPYHGYISTTLASDLKIKSGRDSVVPGFYDGVDFKPSSLRSPGMVKPLGSSNGFVVINNSLQNSSSVKFFSTRFELKSSARTPLLSS